MTTWCRMILCLSIFVFKQKTAYEMRISDWSSDVCSSDLVRTDFVRSRRRGSHIEIELDDPYSLSRKRMTKGFAKSARSARDHRDAIQIGRASCRERVCQTV